MRIGHSFCRASSLSLSRSSSCSPSHGVVHRMRAFITRHCPPSLPSLGAFSTAYWASLSSFRSILLHSIRSRPRSMFPVHSASSAIPLPTACICDILFLSRGQLRAMACPGVHLTDLSSSPSFFPQTLMLTDTQRGVTRDDPNRRLRTCTSSCFLHEFKPLHVTILLPLRHDIVMLCFHQHCLSSF